MIRFLEESFPMDGLDISQWVGRVEQQQGMFDLNTSQRFAATFGGAAEDTCGQVPHLGHWCAFTPLAGMAELGQDGHPQLGGFLPPVQLARRMWAGGSVAFLAPLDVGAPLTRHSEITAVNQKDGAAGPMVFVTVTHDIFQDETRAVHETQDIVYLDIPQVFSPPPARPVPTAPVLDVAVPVCEALLFRYSALTFNAHRIHYDLPYAREVEKYPGLVVHGPLQATLLMQAVLKHAPDRRVAAFNFRGVHPMFHFDDMHLFGEEIGEGMTLCTGLVGGHQGMQAKIIWED